MRNAFVVLVSLCIGLASGFIVPSGVLELDDNHAILADNNGKESEEAKRTTFQEDTGFIVLPFRTHNELKIDLETNQNRIKDKELYDQGTTKHNNVNERSFIYINQKFKTPVVSQLYSAHDSLREIYKPLVQHGDVDEKNNNHNLAKYTPGYSISKPRKEFFEANVGRVETKNLYFPSENQYNQEGKKVVIDENKHDISPKRPFNKVADEQRDYVELLKPPLLRPVFNPEKKENKLWAPPDQSNYKPFQPDTNYHVPNLPVDPLQFSMNSYDNFGFPTPYGYQRSLQAQLNYKPEEIPKVTDNSVKKITNENNKIDVHKLLDQYLKESLEDDVTQERMNVKNINCNNNICVLKSARQYLHSRVKGDIDCKCGRRLNVLKQRESTGFDDKETNTDNEVISSSERNEVNITPRFSESSDYGDMIAEEMNLKKLIED